MNKHRAYWSVMGIKPDNHRREMTERLKGELQRLIDIHGFEKVVTTLRVMHEEGRAEGVQKDKV